MVREVFIPNTLHLYFWKYLMCTVAGFQPAKVAHHYLNFCFKIEKILTGESFWDCLKFYSCAY